MSLNEFMELVRGMRDYQREYFKTRKQAYLQGSKQYERKVDEAVRDWYQRGAFDAPKTDGGNV